MVTKTVFKSLKKGDTAFFNDNNGITRWFIKATNNNSEVVNSQSMLDATDLQRYSLNPLSTVYVVVSNNAKYKKSDFTQGTLL